MGSNLLRKLISIPSVSGDERTIAGFIAAWAQEECGFKTERIDDNVLIHAPGANHSFCLILNGHIDTVSPGEPGAWKSDPFTLTERNGKLYGLGASDMKGGDAAILTMLEHYKDSPPPCDIYAMFVAHEEDTGGGTQTLLNHLQKRLRGYDRVAAIIAEPTDMHVVLGHRGNAFVTIRFDGKGGHGSTPAAFEQQAANKAIRFVESIPDKQAEYDAHFRDAVLGGPSITVTRIAAGINGSPNQIPTYCEVTLDIRTNVRLHTALDSVVAAWVKQFGGKVVSSQQSPVGFCDPTETIARAALEQRDQKQGDVMASSTDQCFFTASGIPAVICGPGQHSTIHAPNEYIDKGVLEEASSHLLDIVNLWSASEP